VNVTDCYAIRHKNNASKSGVYNVILWRSKVVKEIYCDMDTDNGGWTVCDIMFHVFTRLIINSQTLIKYK
jgi:hypothetical protein